MYRLYIYRKMVYVILLKVIIILISKNGIQFIKTYTIINSIPGINIQFLIFTMDTVTNTVSTRN